MAKSTFEASQAQAMLGRGMRHRPPASTKMPRARACLRESGWRIWHHRPPNLSPYIASLTSPQKLRHHLLPPLWRCPTSSDRQGRPGKRRSCFDHRMTTAAIQLLFSYVFDASLSCSDGLVNMFFQGFFGLKICVL